MGVRGWLMFVGTMRGGRFRSFGALPSLDAPLQKDQKGHNGDEKATQRTKENFESKTSNLRSQTQQDSDRLEAYPTKEGAGGGMGANGEQATIRKRANIVGTRSRTFSIRR